MTDVANLPIAVLGPVERGSIVLVDERALPADQPDLLGELVVQIIEKVGHTEFLVVALPFIDGSPPARVYGPSDLVDIIRRAEHMETTT